MAFNINPFGNNKPTSIALTLLVLLFIVGLSMGLCHSAKAAELDFLVGSAAVRGPTATIGMNVRSPGAIGGFADLSAGMNLIGSSNWGGQYNREQAVVHAQVVSHLSKLELGIGVAHLQHDDAYNSGSINFSLSLQYPVYKNFILRYQHFSNSGSSNPNYGRDLLYTGYRFK
jgi:hypothetical protein